MASPHVNFRESAGIIEFLSRTASLLDIISDHFSLTFGERERLSAMIVDSLSKDASDTSFFQFINLLLKDDEALYSSTVKIYGREISDFLNSSLYKLFHHKSSVTNRSKDTLSSHLQTAKNACIAYPSSSFALDTLRSLLYSRMGQYDKASRCPVPSDLGYKNSHNQRFFGNNHYAFGHQCHNFDLVTKSKLLNAYSGEVPCLAHLKDYTANECLTQLNKEVAIKNGIEYFEFSDEKSSHLAILNGQFAGDSFLSDNQETQWYPVALSKLNYTYYSKFEDDILVSSRIDVLSKLTTVQNNHTFYEKFPKDKDYITVYYRTNGFKKESDTFPYNSFRNTSPNHILKIIKALNKQGYYVVLHGDSSQEVLEYEDPLFFDYAHSNLKNDVNDILLIANAKACFSGFGGGFYLPYLFNKPTLLLDWPMTFKPIWSPYVRVLFRKMKFANNTRVPINKFFSDGLHFLEDGVSLCEQNIICNPTHYENDYDYDSAVELFFSQINNISDLSSNSFSLAHWTSCYNWNIPVAVPLYYED